MTNDIAIRYCDEYLARHISDIDKEFLKKAKEALQQEPKTGHWIDGFGGSKCSECGCLEAGHSDYCPNCGAKMSEIPTGSEGSDKE